MEIEAISIIDGLYVLVDEKGRSFLDIDAVKYNLDRKTKLDLKRTLFQVCREVKVGGDIGRFIQDNKLKKITKSSRALKYNLWEVKSPSHGGRIFFIMDEDGNIIVSAVDKFTKDSKAQDKAINRGLNRWEKVLFQN